MEVLQCTVSCNIIGEVQPRSIHLGESGLCLQLDDVHARVFTSAKI
jgi:hypothetical protein